MEDSAEHSGGEMWPLTQRQVSGMTGQRGNRWERSLKGRRAWTLGVVGARAVWMACQEGREAGLVEAGNPSGLKGQVKDMGLSKEQQRA